MLIDSFAPDWLDDLCARYEALPPRHFLILLIDGAFVPGLHRLLPCGAKRLLFESLPCCSDQARDVSPILVRFEPNSRRLTRLLKQCDRWPMVSALETQETADRLAARLAAWCIVEADGQRFNFRFSDTRRLPSILNTLSGAQLRQFLGPAVRWTYLSRDGRWIERKFVPSDAPIADDPVLDQPQFSILVDDSLVDEILSLLGSRGHEVYRSPARSHALVATALSAATRAGIQDQLIDWCEWFWQRDQLFDASEAASRLVAWLDYSRE
ncbi:DUF4123 domain-containing protein [Massilia terrae]|uniref:DUF4123 domain-containing protein n=1 Tax=Massilia terrae TaxID=1811224 RepID=A0ABT2CW49_9BURK|nr:DUF4123 domain-containing protein [Massilia terrae]MCS0658181.1 DUF4123 domain-containing protein [Massilia terrae]